VVDLAELLEPSSPTGTAEYDELLRLACGSPGPPHHILVFCYSRLGEEMPRGIIKDFAQPGHEATLYDMAETFVDRYSGPRSASEWLDPLEMRKLMQRLWQRLSRPLIAATADDPNWQHDHDDLLEFHGSTVCGQTRLTDYDSGKATGRIAAWNRTAAQVVRKVGATTDDGVLAALLGSPRQPFEIIFFLFRSVFATSYKAMAEMATTTLFALTEDLRARYANREIAEEAVRAHFASLQEALRWPVADLAAPDETYRDYERLRDRTIGETKLEDYEMSRLAGDIYNWTHSVRKSLLNRYYRSHLLRADKEEGQ
jgi:hypothetical protein